MAILLETGDVLLLETGDSALLEDDELSSTGSVRSDTLPSSICYASTQKDNAMSDLIVLGAENVAGFVFLNDSDALTTPGGVSVTITDEAGNTETITDSDSRVTLGDVLPVTLRTNLANRSGGRFTAADLAAGTGCVSVIHTPDAAGVWWYFCEGTSTVLGAGRTYTTVLPIAE